MKYDVAIIGGGPAGYTAAERAAQGGLIPLRRMIISSMLPSMR